MDGSSSSNDGIPFSVILGTGATTVLLASALVYVLLDTRRKKSNDNIQQQSSAEVAAQNHTATATIDKELYPGGLVTIYYATQTGTAESFAQQLQREAENHGFVGQVVDLEDTDLTQLVDEARMDDSDGSTKKKARAIFLTATYGEGEAPDNATLFVQALTEHANTPVLPDQKQPEEQSSSNTTSMLTRLDFAVFGLGNRQYDHFNSMGKFFDRALERLGARRIVPLGMGDDDNDLEGDFETWKENVLWPALEKKYLGGAAVPKKKQGKGASLPDCPYAVIYHPAGTTTTKNGIPADEIHSSGRHYFDAVDCPATVVRELRSAQDGDSTVHMEIDVSNLVGKNSNNGTASSSSPYQTADNLGVLPLNSSSIVELVASSLGYDLDAIFSLQAAGSHEWHGAPFPMPLTVRECLTRYCDLTGAPRRSELKLLAAYATDPLDQQALLRMSSKEGKAEYKEKVTETLTGLVHIFQKCPSIQIPLDHFISLCPRLQPRFFTISSSSTVHPKSVHLTVAVTKQQRADGTLFEGVCSTFLAQRQPVSPKPAGGDDVVRCFVRPSSFRLPTDVSKPILLIGPGTGVAPMRALLQERAHQKKLGGLAVGPNILYFGCRKPDLDFLYQDELEAFVKDGTLQQLYTAFSRAQDKKVYVQHLLEQNAAETWHLLDEQGAYIYVCGAVKMGHDVGEALQHIVTAQGKRTPDQAKAYLSQLAANGRYVQELWA